MPESAAVSPARARGVLAILVVVYALNFIDRNLLSVLLQPIKEELGASDSAMGFLTGPAFALFYTAAGIPIARLADRGSRRGLMAVGIAAWSLLTAASGAARSFLQLALLRVGVGIGEATATPAAHSLISDCFPPERRIGAIAVYNLGASAGIFFGLLLGGWLQQSVGWRAAFAVVGLPGVLVALLVRFGLPEPRRGAAEGRRDDAPPPSLRAVLGELLAKRSFVHLCIAAGLYGISAYGATMWAPTFMIRVHGLSYAEVGFSLGLVIGIFGAIGGLGSGWACQRAARRDPRWQAWLPALAGLVAIPCYVVFTLSPDPDLALAAFAAVSLLSIVFAAPTYALAQGLAGLRSRAQAAALVLFVLNLVGLGLGPWLIGALNDAFEPRFGTEAIRYSLTIVAFAGAWGALHSAAAARTLRQDLAS